MDNYFEQFYPNLEKLSDIEILKLVVKISDLINNLNKSKIEKKDIESFTVERNDEWVKSEFKSWPNHNAGYKILINKHREATLSFTLILLMTYPFDKFLIDNVQLYPMEIEFLRINPNIIDNELKLWIEMQ